MRILLVEDNHKIARAIKKGLEQETFSVDLAYDGADGYDLASSEDYDAIILDLMLPGMDGIEICSKLRENKIHIPIIMLTAKSEIEDKIVGLNCGADDYLTKPFSFEELLARLRALLRRPKVEQPVTLKCKDLEMNPQNFEVRRSGKKIELSKKEFSLLEYMLRNKNKILTKEQMTSHVWDYDSDVMPNTVEQYIRYLRSKIDLPFKNLPQLIYTVRGFGYKLVE
jgi:DNA-binding response OmpR family regulator